MAIAAPTATITPTTRSPPTTGPITMPAISPSESPPPDPALTGCPYNQLRRRVRIYLYVSKRERERERERKWDPFSFNMFRWDNKGLTRLNINVLYPRQLTKKKKRKKKTAQHGSVDNSMWRYLLEESANTESTALPKKSSAIMSSVRAERRNSKVTVTWPEDGSVFSTDTAWISLVGSLKLE